MKKSLKRSRPTQSKVTADSISNGVDSRLRSSDQRTRDESSELDGGVCKTLSRHLHDLLNSLWPVAARIELSISDETCPPKFRETLEEFRHGVEEAMTIASQASATVDSPTNEREPS